MGISGRNHVIGPVFYDGNINGVVLGEHQKVVASRLPQLYGQQRNGAIPRVWIFQDSAQDLERHLTYTQWLRSRPDRILQESVVVDEENFYLNGTVTTSNI